MSYRSFDSRQRPVAFISVSLDSTGASQNTLSRIAERTLLAHTVERVRRARRIRAVWVSTSDQLYDDGIADWCAVAGVSCHRSNASSSLERLLDAARAVSATTVVRIPGGCPLMDGDTVDQVVARFAEGDVDWAFTGPEGGWPQGFVAEVCPVTLLEAVVEAWQNADAPPAQGSTLMHMLDAKASGLTPGPLIRSRSLAHLMWAASEADQLTFQRMVFELMRVRSPRFGVDDLERLIDEKPWLEALSAPAPSPAASQGAEGCPAEIEDAIPLTLTPATCAKVRKDALVAIRRC
ncbi:MAG: cytidylyltransferase domain-containing protein [Bradymonadia bacterium]